MSVQEFWEAVKGVSSIQDSNVGVARHGIVAAVNPNNGTVRVRIDEQGTLTGWLPTLMVGTGGGSSVGMIPPVGSQVFFEADMGVMSHGVVLGAVHFSGQPMPQITPYMGEAGPVTPGDPFFIRGANSITLGAAGFTVRGPMYVDGNMTVNGAITATGGITAGQGTGDQVTVQHHTHAGGPQPTPGT